MRTHRWMQVSSDLRYASPFLTTLLELSTCALQRAAIAAPVMSGSARRFELGFVAFGLFPGPAAVGVLVFFDRFDRLFQQRIGDALNAGGRLRVGERQDGEDGAVEVPGGP